MATSEKTSKRKRSADKPDEKPIALRPQTSAAGPDPVMLTRLEETLRVPLDAVLREAIALDMFALPDEAKAHVSTLVAAGRDLTGIITSIARSGLPNPARVTIENAYIDLPRLLRDAHAAVAESAEDRNIAVSWYMAPHLGRRYAGPADRLHHVLRLLMESAVQATERGSVQLWARRVQESNDPGHLVFTVADTGSGMPPERRNPLLPATLWELVGETGGSLHIDSTPSGTTISFSISLKALPAQGLPLGETVVLTAEAREEDETPLALPSLRLILADDAPSRRQLLAYMLEDLPHECIEARSPDEAVALHSEIPARLVLFDGNMPEKELIAAVAAIRAHDGEHELPHTVLLALVGHETQAERLRRAGIDHIVYKPVNRTLLRQAVLHLAPVPGMELPPLPVFAEQPAQEQKEPETTAPVQQEPSQQASPTQQPSPVQQSTHRPSPADAQPPAQPLASDTPLAMPELVLEPQPVNTVQPVSEEPGAPKHSRKQSDCPPQAQEGQKQQVVSLEDAPLSMDDALELPPPARRSKAEKSRRTLGVLHQILGVLPRKKGPLPNPGDTSSEQGTAASFAAPVPPVRPASRSVGEPTPITKRPDAGAAGEQGAESRKPRRYRDEPVTPRYAPSNSDSHLSENGVGDPIPIVRAEPVPSSTPHLSENGVGEPVPVTREAASDPIIPDTVPAQETAAITPLDEKHESNTEPVATTGAPQAEETVAPPAAITGVDAVSAIERQQEEPVIKADTMPEAEKIPVASPTASPSADAEHGAETNEDTAGEHGTPAPLSAASLAWSGSLLDLIETVEPTTAGASTAEPTDASTVEPAGEESEALANESLFVEPNQPVEPGQPIDLDQPVVAAEPEQQPEELEPEKPALHSAPEPVQDAPEAAPTEEHDRADAVIADLLVGLDNSLAAIETALAHNEAESLQTAAGVMAEQAEQFGLHVLAKLSRVVQEMASAPDGLDAVQETMPDLRTAVERNKIAFTRHG